MEATPAAPVTLCVVNYNGEAFLPETLAAALAQRPAFDEVLLIDNASEDRSLALVQQQHPCVRILRLERNRGPAAARNAGFRAASNDRILFLDNDVILAPGCLAGLLEALDRHRDAAVAMPRVLYAHDPETIQYDGADSHFLGLMTLRNANRPARDEPARIRTIGSVVSACVLLDRARWRGGDPFDESFFIYLEDHDFGLRVRAAGKDILSVPAARCLHREGTAGLSLRRSGRYAELRVFCLIRNRWQLILKNYETATLIRLSPVLAVYEAFQLVAVVKKGWIGPWFDALRWIVGHRTEITRKRWAVQSTRIRSDRELLSGGPVPFTTELTQDRLERAGRSLLDRLALALS